MPTINQLWEDTERERRKCCTERDQLREALVKSQAETNKMQRVNYILEQLRDEFIEPHDGIIEAGSRLAIQPADVGGGVMLDWYISYSPRNGNQNAEGQWHEWVELAKMILAEDERKALLETKEKS